MDYDLYLILLICFVYFDKGEGIDLEVGERRRFGFSFFLVFL